MRSTPPARGKRPTLREVSKLAGVSVMTVSNVVNKRFQYVSDKTRARVEKVIKEIRYHPNLTSRRLRASQEFSVGMVIVDDTPAFLAGSRSSPRSWQASATT